MELCYEVFKWTKRESYNKLFLHIHMKCRVSQVALCYLPKPTISSASKGNTAANGPGRKHTTLPLLGQNVTVLVD